MQPRPKVWIPAIVGIFIVAFLVGFQPIRWEREGGFRVESTFAYSVSEPLYETPGEIETVREEILDSLGKAGIAEPTVLIRSDEMFSVETPAVTQEEADADEARVTAALREQFASLQPTQLPGEGEEQKPVATFGPLGFYTPIPQVQLGLDLQGGAHVVLRALPDAEMQFTLEGDQPLVSDAGVAPQAGYTPPFTQEQLSTEVRALLEQQTGARPRETGVEVLGGTILVVHTRPADAAQANAQQAAVYSFLQENYTAVRPEQGDMSTVFVDAQTAEMVQHIIEERIVSMGEITEPTIQKQGTDRIIVQMPGVREPERVLDILKSTALLEFRLVPEKYEPVDMITYREWKDTETGQTVSWDLVRAESAAEFTGRDLLPNSTVQSGQTGDWVVAFELKNEQKDDFNEFTRRNVDRIMAIVLDRECKMAPVIRSAIPGNGIIEGNMTAEEASDLKLLLNAGALPVPLEIVENRTVSATLGRDSITRSLNAAYIGLGAVMLFMILYYRLPGAVACIALMLYLSLTIAVTVYFNVTLTMPGIAGVILTLGTAVDANVIIFERLKEELQARRSLRSAVAAGFDRAWTAILDGNVTTLIAAAVLYWLGTSLIQGFAAMLAIGVLCSLFTAVTVTRWLLTMIIEARWAQKRSLYGVPERPETAETKPA